MYKISDGFLLVATGTLVRRGRGVVTGVVQFCFMHLLAVRFCPPTTSANVMESCIQVANMVRMCKSYTFFDSNPQGSRYGVKGQTITTSNLNSCE